MTCRRRSLRGNKFDPCQSVVVKCKQRGGWYVFRRRMVKKCPFLFKKQVINQSLYTEIALIHTFYANLWSCVTSAASNRLPQTSTSTPPPPTPYCIDCITRAVLKIKWYVTVVVLSRVLPKSFESFTVLQTTVLSATSKPFLRSYYSIEHLDLYKVSRTFLYSTTEDYSSTFPTVQHQDSTERFFSNV